MAIQLLELQQADKLSACKISLSLGLTSEQNLLEQFLQFNKTLMGVTIYDPTGEDVTPEKLKEEQQKYFD